MPRYKKIDPERFSRVYKKHNGDFKAIAKELEITLRAVQRIYTKLYKNTGTEEEKEEAKRLDQETKKVKNLIKQSNEHITQTYTEALDVFKKQMANNYAKFAKFFATRLDVYIQESEEGRLKTSASELTSLLNSGNTVFGKLIAKEDEKSQNNIQVNFELPALKSTVEKDVEDSN